MDESSSPSSLERFEVCAIFLGFFRPAAEGWDAVPWSGAASAEGPCDACTGPCDACTAPVIDGSGAVIPIVAGAAPGSAAPSGLADGLAASPFGTVLLLTATGTDRLEPSVTSGVISARTDPPVSTLDPLSAFGSGAEPSPITVAAPRIVPNMAEKNASRSRGQRGGGS